MKIFPRNPLSRFLRQNSPATAGRMGALALAVALVPAPALGADLTISLSDLGDDSGMVMFNLLRNEAQMNGAETPQASMMVSPSADGIKVTLHDLEPGTYGVQVMHDENGNGELDANMLGIPKEPWGFSNNAKGKFGPPKWDAVQFTIDAEPVVQEISLNK